MKEGKSWSEKFGGGSVLASHSSALASGYSTTLGTTIMWLRWAGAFFNAASTGRPG